MLWVGFYTGVLYSYKDWFFRQHYTRIFNALLLETFQRLVFIQPLPLACVSHIQGLQACPSNGITNFFLFQEIYLTVFCKQALHLQGSVVCT
jgi:hypothetical protein